MAELDKYFDFLDKNVWLVPTHKCRSAQHFTVGDGFSVFVQEFGLPREVARPIFQEWVNARA